MRKIQSIIAASVGTAALIATFTLAGAGAANASTTSASKADDSADTSCWVDADSGQSLCVPAGEDLIAAVQQEAGITISTSDGATVNGVGGATLRSDLAVGTLSTSASSAIISELFDDINYGGGSMYLTSSSGCGGGLSTLVPYGWNDRASSFKSFDGCETAIWQNIGYSGTKLGYATNKSSFGSMNDAASSWSTE